MINVVLAQSLQEQCITQCLKGGATGGACAISCLSNTTDKTEGTIINPALGRLSEQSGVSFFQSFLPRLLTMGLVIGVIIFFFIFIMGAIQWISSGGDKNALEGAKSKITNAIIGIIILFAVFAVIKVIENFMGISILTLDIGSLVIR